MKTQKLKGMNLEVPPGSAFKIETAKDMPKLHTVCVAVGKRGSGKSVLLTNMIKMYKRDNNLSCRTLIISPTILSNKALLDDLNIEPEDVFDDPDDPSIVDHIKAIVQGEADDYVEFKHKIKRYKALVKSFDNVVHMDDEDKILLEFFDPISQTFKAPTHRHNGKRPTIFLLCDDCLSTKLYSNKKFQNLCIRSRHIGEFEEGGALGLSIFMAIQSWKSNSGAYMKVIRNQATCIGLFKTKDLNELKDISQSCGGEISEENFYEIYNYAIQNPHDSLFIDFHPKEEKYRFRRNFNTLIFKE